MQSRPEEILITIKPHIFSIGNSYNIPNILGLPIKLIRRYNFEDYCILIFNNTYFPEMGNVLLRVTPIIIKNQCAT